MNDLADTPRRQTWMRLAIVLLVAGLVIGFVVRGDRSIVGDERLLKAIQSVEFTGLEPVVTVVDFIGTTVGGIIAATILIAIGLVVGYAWYALQVMIVVGLRLIGEVLKPTIESPRPPLDYLRDPDRALTTFGYPSGHAFTYACIAGMVIVLAFTLNLAGSWRWSLVALGCLLVLAGAFARPWLGLHWPYDMVGGTIFGATAVMIALAIIPVRTLRDSDGR